MKTLLIPHGAKKRIAEAAGVSQNTVSAWFTGKHLLGRNKDKVVRAFIEVLGVCPEFIAGRASGNSSKDGRVDDRTEIESDGRGSYEVGNQ